MRHRFAFALLVLSAPAFADEAPPPPPPWTGEASAGIVSTSGNTKSESSNAKAEVVYQSKDWRNTTDATALHTAQTQTDPLTGAKQKQNTAERYTIGNKTDYNFTERDYAFFAAEYDKDLFGPIARQSSETAGYGRKILLGPTHTLEAEIGAGARQSTTQDNLTVVPPVFAVSSNDAIGRARVAYKYHISDTTSLSETAHVESGKSNTASESVTEFKLQLVGKLFMVVNYTFRNNTHAPVGTSRTDTITAINLGWSFGK